jgi:hypothetical protein
MNERIIFQDFNCDDIWNGIIKNVYGETTSVIPTMVFSIIGDSNTSVPKSWPKAVFQIGLIEAAKNGGGKIKYI